MVLQINHRPAFVRTFKRKRKSTFLILDTFVDNVVELYVDECVELVFVDTFVA